MTTEPLPDPTPLTTAQLLRVVQSLREVVDTRFNAVEKAIALAHEDAVRIPTDIDRAVGQLKELHQSRFESSEKAVDRQNGSFALSLQKTEESLSKQIDALMVSREVTTKSLESQISDLKDRVTQIESFRNGQTVATTSSQTQSNWQVGTAVSVASVLIALGAVLVTVLR